MNYIRSHPKSKTSQLRRQFLQPLSPEASKECNQQADKEYSLTADEPSVERVQPTSLSRSGQNRGTDSIILKIPHSIDQIDFFDEKGDHTYRDGDGRHAEDSQTATLSAIVKQDRQEDYTLQVSTERSLTATSTSESLQPTPTAGPTEDAACPLESDSQPNRNDTATTTGNEVRTSWHETESDVQGKGDPSTGTSSLTTSLGTTSLAEAAKASTRFLEEFIPQAAPKHYPTTESAADRSPDSLTSAPEPRKVLIVDSTYVVEPSEDFNQSIVEIFETDGYPYYDERQSELDQKYKQIRKVKGCWSMLKPLVCRLHRRDEVAADAFLCYTKGIEASIQCKVCAGEADLHRVFAECIIRPEEFGLRCANCIMWSAHGRPGGGGDKRRRDLILCKRTCSAHSAKCRADILASKLYLNSELFGRNNRLTMSSPSGITLTPSSHLNHVAHCPTTDGTPTGAKPPKPSTRGTDGRKRSSSGAIVESAKRQKTSDTDGEQSWTPIPHRPPHRAFIATTTMQDIVPQASTLNKDAPYYPGPPLTNDTVGVLTIGQIRHITTTYAYAEYLFKGDDLREEFRLLLGYIRQLLRHDMAVPLWRCDLGKARANANVLPNFPGMPLGECICSETPLDAGQLSHIRDVYENFFKTETKKWDSGDKAAYEYLLGCMEQLIHHSRGLRARGLDVNHVETRGGPDG
ncbi:hypothetical protein GE09DRAFT_172541 [Coniochaeta sp. 2T2.1]|nr:hypothetical protein GE09DRAFT_172541 [Coniochaeta sp. 2T2.1]